MSDVLPKSGFQSPYDAPTPAGAEGWEEMYPYYLLFDPARREEEENRFWFYNRLHRRRRPSGRRCARAR